MSSSGSVYQRGDGPWCAAVAVAGRKIVRYGKTKREAQQRLRELLNQVHQGTLAAPTKMTLAEWVQRWSTSCEGDRRPSTVRSYRLNLAPLVERLGTVRLDKLTPMMLDFTFAELRRAGIGTRRIQQGYAVLHTSLNEAVL